MEVEAATEPNHSVIKAPVSAYILFIKDLKTKQGNDSRNFLQEASKKWAELPAEEKAHYQTQSSLMKAQYQQQQAESGKVEDDEEQDMRSK